MDKNKTADFSNPETLEKYSSAFTLSDMEIFIFPELFYPLVIANIMSPLIWKWNEDPWFSDISRKNFSYKVNRIKQYIIQNYVFNLDLSTWGLTTKTQEIERFRQFFNIDLLKQSNALFGYEGDKYYFDIDIRKHFGLDKYESDIIPYWKTETIEAMTAFRHKANFATGAGECVSLSALYAAALFVVGKIPLENIFLIATPLHSQNFIIEKEGLITNNRRIVTKNMWFNGTSLSEKARRALRNENVTVVSHITGYIHLLKKTATINRNEYNRFTSNLKKYLKTDLTKTIFLNFLRFKPEYKSLFQYECENCGTRRYIGLDKIFEYEHSSRFNLSSETRDRLMKEIDGDEFHLSPLQNRIMLNEVDRIMDNIKGNALHELEKHVLESNSGISQKIIHDMFSELSDFLHIDPKLPDENKDYIPYNIPEISPDDSRENIITNITNSSEFSEFSELVLYVYREMGKTDWTPFIKAAIERNPVCFNELRSMSVEKVHEIISQLPDESIYDGTRLAQPDEVWNFKRGDGIEKAFLLAGFISQKDFFQEINITIDKENVILKFDNNEYYFRSLKSFNKSIIIRKGKYIAE
ncbi:MAG: hypothetical protein GXY51_08285 [Bacteroidetes bacterium]|jgi:hypothetical protein|nr:hypothetical protein [Bacteroidota bacterium]